MGNCNLFRKVFVLVGFLCGVLAGSAAAQSQEFMVNECSSTGQTYFRDFNARTDMRYNGQRVDGTHAINGRIFLETRFEDFACSYDRNGRRMLEFFAEGRVQNAYLPGGGSSGQGSVVQVTGLQGGDTLNVRSGPGTSFGVVGALTNGTSVRNLGCEMRGNTRWCQIEMQTDMRERGWVNARFLSRQSGQATQLPSASRMQRVRFPSGSTGTELSDQLGAGTSVTYILNARNGQNLYFRLAASGPNMAWRLFTPNGSLLDRGGPSKEYRGQLFRSGEHRIEVTNSGNRPASFNVIFGIE